MRTIARKAVALDADRARVAVALDAIRLGSRRWPGVWRQALTQRARRARTPEALYAELDAATRVLAAANAPLAPPRRNVLEETLCRKFAARAES